MRLQLNLNQLYEGLDNVDVNRLFGLFMHAETSIQSLEYGLERIADPDYNKKYPLMPASLIEKVEKKPAYERLSQINAFLISRGKAPAFPDLLGKDYMEIDYTETIRLYKHYISEPEAASK